MIDSARSGGANGMCLLKWMGSLGLICTSLLAQPGQAQNAPASPPGPGEFAFRVCNGSGMTLNFAFIHLNSPNDSQFRSIGWYSVPAGECPHSFPINFLQGKFYYFAFGWSPNGTIYLVEGTVLRLCVDWLKGFNQLAVGGASCGPFPKIHNSSAGIYSAGFAELTVPRSVDSITVSIKPPP
jgi:hypothetical protein